MGVGDYVDVGSSLNLIVITFFELMGCFCSFLNMLQASMWPRNIERGLKDLAYKEFNPQPGGLEAMQFEKIFRMVKVPSSLPENNDKLLDVYIAKTITNSQQKMYLTAISHNGCLLRSACSL